jgi:DNA-binding CsgD family transcriptional regulator
MTSDEIRVKQSSLRQQCFCTGITEIIKRLKAHGSYADYKFIDFDEKVLNSISTDEFTLTNCQDKCVLVSSKKLLPLALFYYQHFGFISTVIQSDKSIDFSVGWLIHLNGKRRLTSRLSGSRHLSQNEVITLEGFMVGKNINIIAKSLGKHPKTIYNYRKKIAVKMGLKRLENLFVFIRQ